MPRLTGPTAAGIASLLPYFNSLMGAIESGATVSDLWDAYRNAVAIAGGEIGNPSIFDMNYVAGQARSILTAEGNLAAAAGGDAIAGDMWAYAPWAAGETGSFLVDNYQIRYQASLTGPEGDIRQVWGVTDWNTSLEGLTKDQIVGRAFTSGQEALDSGSQRIQQQLGFLEGYALTGIDRVQIMRI